MASFNRVILLGNITRDIELSYIASGSAVANVGLAVNDKRKNKDGEWIEETTFVDVTLWGRTAEIANEYLSKGSPCLIEGRLKLDTWEDNDGNKRSKLKVVGEKLQLLGGRRDGDGGGNGGGGSRGGSRNGGNSRGGSSSRQSSNSYGGSNEGGSSYDGGSGGGDNYADDDIPF